MRLLGSDCLDITELRPREQHLIYVYRAGTPRTRTTSYYFLNQEPTVTEYRPSDTHRNAVEIV